tara:strand:- start:234 stop:647 length:414 start_codon:yes stop_codon:yes gene_type:complete
LNSKISDKDKNDWLNFLSNDEKILDKDLNTNLKKSKKTFTFDLHGYSLDEANKKIKDLVFESYNKKISKLIIVTGKGLHSQNELDPYISKDLGILKNSVPHFLRKDDELMKMISNIKVAHENDGGSGAFYIFLKKKL